MFHDFKLKCFLLVDLKLGKLTHQDVGQMDTYVRLYDERIRSGRQPDHQQPWTAMARRPLTEGPKDLTTTGRGPPESQPGAALLYLKTRGAFKLVSQPVSSLTISAPLSPSCRVGTYRRSARYAVHVPPCLKAK